MRRLPLLLLAALAALPQTARAADPYEPDTLYEATLTMTRTASFDPSTWQQWAAIFVQGVNSTTPEWGGTVSARVDGDTISTSYSAIPGRQLNLSDKGPIVQDVYAKVTSARALNSPATPAAAPPATNPPAAATPAPDDRPPPDFKEKPVYNTGTKEARQQELEAAAELDRAHAEWVKNGRKGREPLKGESILGRPVLYAGSKESRERDLEVAAELDREHARWVKEGKKGPEPLTGEGYLGKDVPGTIKKPARADAVVAPPPTDTRKLSDRIMNRGTPPPPSSGGTSLSARNVLGVWSDPKRPAKDASDYNMVVVLVDGAPAPLRLTLAEAKRRGLVDRNTTYKSLTPYNGSD